jgi:NAD(P)-dependent dehydrogenase (short-subunit alcohol dehydrogenase family)
VLKNRHILITGASRGLGFELAKACGAAGAHVIAVARSKSGLEKLDDAIQAAGGEAATLVPMDVTQFAMIDQLGAQLFERFGKLDGFVANAACLQSLAPAHHIPPPHWERTFNTNLIANMRFIRSLDPLLRKSEHGRAIFVTCSLGRGDAFWGTYTASKAGLEALAASYASETENYPLRVTTIDPGPMGTGLHQVAFPGIELETLPHPSSAVPGFLEALA